MMVKMVATVSVAVLLATSAMAQNEATPKPGSGSNAGANQIDPEQFEQGQLPDEANGARQAQPQGPTGPLDTTSGGAPAASPQGDAPSGMQVIPPKSSAKGDPTGH